MKEDEYRYWNYDPFIHEKGSYEELLNRYYSSHKRCPECKSTRIIRNLVSYQLDPNNYEDFKDGNGANCDECNWLGIVHDLKQGNQYNGRTHEYEYETVGPVTQTEGFKP